MDVWVGSTSAATASCLFMNQNGVVGGGGGSGIGTYGGGGGGGPHKVRPEQEDSCSSTSSSSIGAPDDSDEENGSKAGSGDVTDSEEVQSKFRGGLTSLGSMDSLEDSLPIKRGLSNYFSGKSKSFQSLSDVVTTATTVKELEKRDNPLNKRRRVLIASKWSRKSSSFSSFYNHSNPKSMPLLASLNEDEDEDEDEQEPEETQEDLSSGQSSSDEKEPQIIRTPRLLDRGLKSFKSRSCYCLSDLQQT